MTQTETFSKIPFENLRGDMHSRVVAKFVENWLLGSCQNFEILLYCIVLRFVLRTKNLAAWDSSEPFPFAVAPTIDRSGPNFSERCRPLTCACVPNLVRIGWGLPELFPRH